MKIMVNIDIDSFVETLFHRKHKFIVHNLILSLLQNYLYYYHFKLFNIYILNAISIKILHFNI